LYKQHKLKPQTTDTVV